MMKKLLKVLAWIAGIAVLGIAGLTAVGISTNSKAEKCVMETTGYKDVKVLTTSDDILCKGGEVGIVVREYVTPERKIYPVCTGLTGDASLGVWKK